MMKERHRIYLWLGENGEKMNRERRKELKGGNNGYEMWKMCFEMGSFWVLCKLASNYCVQSRMKVTWLNRVAK